MPETILIISNASNGLFLFRRELIEKLIVKYNVEVLVADTGRVEELKNIGCNVTIIDIERRGKNPIKEFQLLIYFKDQIKRLHPKIVLTYTIKPNVYAGMACASLNVPYIANITGLGTAVENDGLLQRITLILLKRGLRKAQIVFFQNAENRDFLLKQHIIKGNYDLIPGSGVNLKRFPLLEYPKGDLVHFLFISRIQKEKGIDQYIDAAKYIREKYPNSRFHVCGEAAKAYSNILEELTENRTIIYHGKVNDVVEKYRISSCIIHPTYYPEGMSNVLLESCSCGRPIITTDRSGCREIVDDGINGFVVKQRDSQDLINKIEKFLKLDWVQRRNMGLAGRIKVEREFDRNIVIGRYLEEIEK